MKIIDRMRMPGPNRHSGQSVVQFKIRLQLESRQPEHRRVELAEARLLEDAVRDWSMAVLGNPAPAFTLPKDANTTGAACAGWCIAALAVWLQQQAGHLVSECGAFADSDEPLLWIWLEYDHPEVGERATGMALEVIRRALGLLDEGDRSTPASSQQWQEFREFAQPRKLPLETRALVAAAARRDIPCFKLDRYPYDPLEGSFRVRPHGLLRLGHARFQVVLDGTLCVNRNTQHLALLQDPRSRRGALQAAGVTWVDSVSDAAQQILFIGGQPIAVLSAGQRRDVTEIPAPACQQLSAVQQRYQLPIFSVAIAPNGCWSGFELAPRLETWFPDPGSALDNAADRLLEQFYPPGSQYRIPIVSVTGTNGKTTTCTMLRKIFQQAGKTPVVECSNGIFVGNKPQGSRRDIGPASTWFALESTAADVAVFEDYFGRIARFGFAYEWSDVAVCTNVTPDHLHHFGVHTLEDLAEVKFAVISRARHGVVLNADNAGCASMLGRATASRKVAVSMNRDRTALAHAHPDVKHFCVLEQQDGKENIVLYDGEAHIPLLAVNDIPATREGQARHNISNAMHAAAAAWLLGVGTDSINAALSAFAVDFESCPGRLNEFKGLPFRVIMDYAHNEDGLRQVCSFVDAQKVSGRKFIKTSFYDDRRDSEIRAAMGVLAGHFDSYTCSRFGEKRRVVTENIPELMRDVLLENGVASSAIRVASDSGAAVQMSLQEAQPGDLVVLLVDSAEFEDLWQHLNAIKAAMASRPANE